VHAHLALGELAPNPELRVTSFAIRFDGQNLIVSIELQYNTLPTSSRPA
jgi:hypothetical protein